MKGGYDNNESTCHVWDRSLVYHDGEKQRWRPDHGLVSRLFTSNLGSVQVLVSGKYEWANAFHQCRGSGNACFQNDTTS